VDAVVVGGGTVGGWAAVFLAEEGHSVVLLEAATLGAGASSRAAGMVRAQGGTEPAVRLGMFTRDFYRSQRDRYPLDSGFVAQGYLMPCFTESDVAAARARIALQRSLGLDVEWLEPEEVDGRGTGLASGSTLGASYAPGDGYIDAPRNVLAYSTALTALGVDIRERTAFLGLSVRDGRVVGVRTSAGDIATEHVLLTGGPSLADVAAVAGGVVHVGGTRHQVVVTAPLRDVDVHSLPMAFDIGAGIYWRPGEDGGLLWGMSNPDEPPGPAIDFDWSYYEQMHARLQQLLPCVAGLGLKRVWAATIDYTPDHLPVLGSLLTDGGAINGTIIAAAGGHGMMWGPGVARAAADLLVRGRTEIVDVADLGMDRFDAHGRSRLAADPIALPFPQQV
jgi:sarcosine oxidase subunit beta